MQPNLFPFGSVFSNPLLFNGDLSEAGFESSRVFFLVPFLLSQGGGMDLSKVGEKILSSVRSARSLGLLPSTSDRPEVPARAAGAAAVARVLAGLPPHQRFNLPSSSEELRSIYGTQSHGQSIEELEEDFYEEGFDPIKHILEHIPSEENELEYFEKQAALRLAQLDRVAEQLSYQVMEHHEVMGMLLYAFMCLLWNTALRYSQIRMVLTQFHLVTCLYLYFSSSSMFMTKCPIKLASSFIYNPIYTLLHCSTMYSLVL